MGQTPAEKISREIFPSAQTASGLEPRADPKQAEGSSRAPLLPSEHGKERPSPTPALRALHTRAAASWAGEHPSVSSRLPLLGRWHHCKRLQRGSEASKAWSLENTPNHPLLSPSKASLPGERANSSHTARMRTPKCGQDHSPDASREHKGSEAPSMFLTHRELVSWWKSGQ